ncbi:pentapeptide repeat-containing protein [Cyanobium sp. Aljojuca 7D2]|uniref:pentapeptide repeat-containing protein n=1 Tax=Cyanobium sp. Aljojuca 7D2 TaxID=2823698 RepID=UPI0020CCE2CA|nr:pentapeptide repeat-containing protein [Cyanobium sp. Aljojuca 7D2]
MPRQGHLLSAAASLLAAVAVLMAPTAKADSTDLFKLLDTRSCRGCKLQDADLVHADLRDADLRQAQLQRANLGQARLDGAQLGGANLSFTSLMGASLRGADLRGARLDGTDLRQADLSGALLDPGALSRSHWQRATGITAVQLSYAELHNAGAEAAQQGRYPEAEQFFSQAVRKDPNAAISWVARGICRSEQGKIELATRDFSYAANLYRKGGEVSQAEQLQQAAEKLAKADEDNSKGGNGAGGKAISGALAVFQYLAPIAANAFMPLGF